ncbi:unnamed protein product [Trifolium pratense]|uniref:Uncharacterized protein n=1 Tax=Trifolium pratense TaxID=57577 RepID=A0ACB0KB82_TRIPR|nr:unnamed protein product [Trifolium pratense]
MSGKELLECQGKNKRVADVIRNSPPEAPTNNSPAKPLKKRHRPEASSSPHVQFPRRSQPSSSEGVSVDDMWTSFFTEINGGGDGDDSLIRDLIDKHFGKEKFHEKVKELGLERELQNSMADCIRLTFLLRVIGGMFGDSEKENKAFVGEIMELKKLMNSLKNERDKLKKTLEESIVEKSSLVARGKNLIEENYKCNVKLLIKEDAHKVIVDKLKAEIEELKGEISLQYKAGYYKAVNQVLYFASRLKPWRS